MTHLKYKRLFGWFAVAIMLLTTSCKDELFSESGQSDEVTVSFTLTPEAATTVVTRADGNVTYPTTGKGMYGHISDGSKADVLIYAVYDSKWQLVEGYGKGVVDEELKELYKEGEIDGQTIMKIKQFPITLNMSFKRGETYTVAFWAQSSKTKAYDTKNLKKVEVHYSEIYDGTNSTGGNTGKTAGTDDSAQTDGLDDENGTDNSAKQPVAKDINTTTPNNDEFRDAFCRSVTINTGTTGNIQQNVYLYRPLSQINVGTSGFDFETITRNADKKYLYSKIRLNRVARYLDVVEDKTYTTTTGANHYTTNTEEQTAEAFAVVDFGYAPIPAYVNYRNESNLNTYALPEFPSYTVWDWAYYDEKDEDGNAKEYVHPHGKTKDDYIKEEFLRVRLYDRDDDGNLVTRSEEDKQYTDDDFSVATYPNGLASEADNYLDYANLTKNQTCYTKNEVDLSSETFKYLSMCYVLTSSQKSTNEEEGRILINNVKVWLATDANGSDSVEVVNLNNVPAQRNWRTNIVGNLLTENVLFDVTLDRDFAGEYNGWKVDGQWEFSGPLSRGVYYDAENDEIQISDADGLIWFQRMVNGQLKVRSSNGLDQMIDETPAQKKDEDYVYYKKQADGSYSDTATPYKEDGYSAIDFDEEVAKRIMKATHQDFENGDVAKWPEANNFHFKGATVKLMADIDLTGKEWIPIGLDYKVAEFKTRYEETASNSKLLHKPFDESIESNRGFYGTFDGNGHTISNLTTKRFSAKIPDGYYEYVTVDAKGTESDETKSSRNYDAFPWFGRGLFGAIGGNAEIRNVRLYNVDILGCNGVGGIVGIAYGQEIKIENCIVDGGELVATPMYRHNTKNIVTDAGTESTFARGTYLGGIVGYFNTRGGILKNCSVRNLTLRGYRQVGGLIGTIDKKYDKNSNAKDEDVTYEKTPTVEGNSVSNTVIIASQLHFPFGLAPHIALKVNDKNTGKLADVVGFGWDLGTAYDLYSGELLGGDSQEYLSRMDLSGNQTDGVTFSEMTETVQGLVDDPDNDKEENRKVGDKIRVSTIQASPLKNMPALSSWFTDEVTLYGNYYGETSAYKQYKTYSFPHLNYNETYPMQLPMAVEIDWVKNAGQKVGLYVESVALDGAGGIGGRSVITPTGITGEGTACMYVTARDRVAKYYSDTDEKGNQREADDPLRKSKPTNISNVVLRGDPYAYTGLLLAPNENMSEVNLTKVYIYDVYQTIALDKTVYSNNNQWPKAQPSASGVTLTLTDCNLRGYTVPGAGWAAVNHTDVTFEQGAYTQQGNEEDRRTYKVEAKTTFKDCIFKAPYIIEIANEVTSIDDMMTGCKASAAAPGNTDINLDLIKGKGTCTKIEINSDAQGEPQVTYYVKGSDGTMHKYDKDGNQID